MSAVNRPRWVITVAMAAVLVAVLVFLFVKTRHELTSDYFANMALLQHVKQLDSKWELDVLRARAQVGANYDSLADAMRELVALVDRFRADMPVQLHEQTEALVAGADDLRQLIEQKDGLIERFKSSNAVLRNSLNFLSSAAEDVHEASGRGARGPGHDASVDHVLAEVDRLLLTTMLYRQRASDEIASRILGSLNRLEAQRRLLPDAMVERLDAFVAHVRTIFREQSVVNALLADIETLPTATRVDAISSILSAEQTGALERSERYRRYMLVFSAILIGLFLFAAMRLGKSHAEVNRVNKALHAANETLERRVGERTHELELAHSEIVKTAREAGMAQVATNVLHNVGNVLNSVNVSAAMIASTVRASKVEGLTRAVQLMNEHADDVGAFLSTDERGKMLPDYLGHLAAALMKEHRGIAAELTTLDKNVGHIKDIITAQQTYARSSKLIELSPIDELVEDALRINADTLARHRVTVEKRFAEVAELPLDKARVVQILVNLIANANRAMELVEDRERRLTLTIDAEVGKAVRVSVADTGVGIAQENLSRVFGHGFTTRKDGHGFGLHSAAIAAREMGGALTVRSGGHDAGATFTLEVPVEAIAETA